MSRKPILCLDFDGVLHSYTSGWKGADQIPDPPVPGAIKFLEDASQLFEIHIFSSRSNQPGGIEAMTLWLANWILAQCDEPALWIADIKWPKEKPPAFLTIDDRALQFTGKWPMPADLLDFKPWNKR